MKLVSKADFDFSKAGKYRKIELLAKEHVRKAVAIERIVTVNSAGKETENTAQPGDYIIRTSDEDDGYVMLADRFFEVYEDDPAKEGFYRSKITRLCLMTPDAVRFMSPWGQEQTIPAGSVVVEAGDNIYGIDRYSFIRKYARVDNTAEHNTFALMSEPLEMQLEKAVALGLAHHIADIELRMNYRNLFEKKANQVTI